tara:strand:+ start:2006 stop:2524 length:519 start_codon:yes stop_codon:yes gene_type:complete
MDEAFVESRKGVQRHGFWKHLILVCFVAILIGGGVPAAIKIFDEQGFAWIWLVPVLVQPIGLGLLVSAYRQTLEVEVEQKESYDREFEEMRDELQTADDIRIDLLPKGNTDLVGYPLDEGDSHLALVVEDVSGKAMERAITALRFNEMLRYETRNCKDPTPILEGFNDSLDG